jgi:two-component system phosphate regulon sensor histidine kinase PhoR
VFVFSDQKHLVAVNPAAEKLMMATEAQLLGKHAHEVFFRYPDLVNQYLDVTEVHAEIVLPLRKGDRTYELLISPIYQRQDHLAGRLVVLRDITERKLASRRDFELDIERERTRLLASFIQYSSHDLRTPLSKMNMALHIARRTDDPQKRLEKLNAIEREILKMTNIIEEMHLLTRLESGTPVALKTVSLDQVVQLTPRDIQQIIIEKRLSLRLPQESNVLVCGDLDLLRQAFRSLLHNAAIYTPEDGSISVSITAQSPWGMVEVADTGMGIEGAQLELIFEHFAKVNPARTSDGSGAGLGLAIVKKVMEVHQGRVTVLSNPGQGSTFCLMLPLADVEASPYERIAPSNP